MNQSRQQFIGTTRCKVLSCLFGMILAAIGYPDTLAISVECELSGGCMCAPSSEGVCNVRADGEFFCDYGIDEAKTEDEWEDVNAPLKCDALSTSLENPARNEEASVMDRTQRLSLCAERTGP